MVEAVTDEKPSNARIDILMKEFSTNQKTLSLEEFRTLLTTGRLTPCNAGRKWVILSLAEAETIRRILHVRRNQKNVIVGSSTDLALRYSPACLPSAAAVGDGGLVFDASPRWRDSGTGATTYEAALAHVCFRFFDGDMHFSLPALNILIRALCARYVDLLQILSCNIFSVNTVQGIVSASSSLCSPVEDVSRGRYVFRHSSSRS